MSGATLGGKYEIYDDSFYEKKVGSPGAAAVLGVASKRLHKGENGHRRQPAHHRGKLVSDYTAHRVRFRKQGVGTPAFTLFQGKPHCAGHEIPGFCGDF